MIGQRGPFRVHAFAAPRQGALQKCPLERCLVAALRRAALGVVLRLEVALEAVGAAAGVLLGPGVALGVEATTLAVKRVLADRDEGAAAVVLGIHGVHGALVAGRAAGGPVPALTTALAVRRGAVGRVGRGVHALACGAGSQTGEVVGGAAWGEPAAASSTAPQCWRHALDGYARGERPLTVVLALVLALETVGAAGLVVRPRLASCCRGTGGMSQHMH